MSVGTLGRVRGEVMRKIAIAAATSLLAAFQGAGAQQNDPEFAERLREALDERATTRPRLAPPPIGTPAREAAVDAIDWIEMRRALAVSAQRDSAARRQTTTAVIARPPGLRAATAERFRRVAAIEINLTRLPLLAPEGTRVAETLKVYSLGDSYSAIAEVDNGVGMRMSGARRKIIVGDLKSARSRVAAMRAERKSLPSIGAPYLITRSESATDLTFAAFGAGYVLSIMCDAPDDIRCAEDDFITKLASNILLFNPEAGEQ